MYILYTCNTYLPKSLIYKYKYIVAISVEYDWVALFMTTNLKLGITCQFPRNSFSVSKKVKKWKNSQNYALCQVWARNMTNQFNAIDAQCHLPFHKQKKKFFTYFIWQDFSFFKSNWAKLRTVPGVGLDAYVYATCEDLHHPKHKSIVLAHWKKRCQNYSGTCQMYVFICGWIWLTLKTVKFMADQIIDIFQKLVPRSFCNQIARNAFS